MRTIRPLSNVGKPTAPGKATKSSILSPGLGAVVEPALLTPLAFVASGFSRTSVASAFGLTPSFAAVVSGFSRTSSVSVPPVPSGFTRFITAYDTPPTMAIDAAAANQGESLRLMAGADGCCAE